MKNPEQEDGSPKKNTLMLRGPTTLTSLMTQDKENANGMDYMYLNIATLRRDKVFVSCSQWL